MRVEWALVCRNAEQTEEGSILYGLGVDTSESEVFPCHVVLTVAAFLTFNYEEARRGGESPIRVVVHGNDPTAPPVFDREWTIPISMVNPDQFYEGWMAHMVQDIPVDFEVDEESTFTIAVSAPEGESSLIAYRVREPLTGA